MAGTTSVKWSILIPTLPARRRLLKRLLKQLEPQLEGREDIELLILEDNRKRSYGDKMQALLDIALGEYVCFVDDDDEISEDYVETFYDLMTGVDCIGFTAQISIERGPWQNVFYSMKHQVWRDDEHGYYRNPQHLTPIKRSIAKQIPWRGHYGADRDWSERLGESGLIQTENVTDKVLYFYHSTQVENREGVWK